ncbi:MAG TPA: PAS domain S-box protein, partial [Candidatus Lokiarchaeia archaeon]|nr:PAS domain S-box protein [Candidatus Lokiarchaeia archaeon]
NGNIMAINRKGCEILCGNEKEIVGKNWFKGFLPFPIQDQVHEMFRNMINGEIEAFEKTKYTILTCTGRERLFVWNNALFYNEDGRVIGIISSGEDITDRRLTEKVLHESEQRSRDLANSLKSYLDIAGVIFLVIDVRGFVTLINRKGCEILGRPEEEIIGKPWFEMFVPKRIQPVIKSVFRQVIGGEIESAEYHENPVVTRTGEERLIAWHNAVIRDSVGHITGTLSSGEDITERRQAEEALRESEEKYRNLFETAPVGIGVGKFTGEVVDINPALLKIMGATLNEMKSFKISNFYINPADRDTFLSSMRENGAIRDFEIKQKRFDGSEFIALLNAVTIKQKGEPMLLINIRDITSRKQAEENLQQLYEETLHISQMKSNLLTFASHELKTPLVPILGWTEFLKTSLEKGKNIEEIVGYDEVSSMYNASMRLNRIIENFLDVSRLEAGRFDLQRKMQSAIKLVQIALQNVQRLADSQEMQVNINVQDMDLLVDGFRMEQVFINILTNAIKYSPPRSEIWIESSCDDSFYTFTFTDQGLGFTPEELEDVWRPFSPSFLRKKTEQSVPGTGVGLYLAKGIVELHGGTIEIDSQGRDKGTIVSVAIPVHPPEDFVDNEIKQEDQENENLDGMT